MALLHSLPADGEGALIWRARVWETMLWCDRIPPARRAAIPASPDRRAYSRSASTSVESDTAIGEEPLNWAATASRLPLFHAATSWIPLSVR